MLVLAHTGITLAAALLLAGTANARLPRSYSPDSEGLNAGPSPALRPSQTRFTGAATSALQTLARRVDIRLLLIASLLPDIIDKPLGLVLFSDTFHTGRMLCHTLLFVSLLAILGMLLYRKRSATWLLVLAFGSFIHLLLDQMWLNPRTFLWPLYGLSFEPDNLTNWTLHVIQDLISQPALFLGELAGLAILLWFGAVLMRNGTLYLFLKTGAVWWATASQRT